MRAALCCPTIVVLVRLPSTAAQRPQSPNNGLSACHSFSEEEVKQQVGSQKLLGTGAGQ